MTAAGERLLAAVRDERAVWAGWSEHWREMAHAELTEQMRRVMRLEGPHTTSIAEIHTRLVMEADRALGQTPAETAVHMGKCGGERAD